MTPAKMHPLLARDLFLRYTLPGQVVLDPFFGRGTSLIGCTLGRHIIGVELEPPFVEDARRNYDWLKARMLPDLPLGEAVIHQGDSRRLPLPTAADACISSPPYADAIANNQTDQRARKAERYARGEFAAKRPDVFTSEKNVGAAAMFASDYGRTPGQIGRLPPGDVAAAITSPPYADLADRNRSAEPYSQAMDPLLKAKYGTGDVNRHIDGYGDTPGQIGSLPHDRGVAAVVSSPPFAETLATSHASQRDWVRANGKPQGFGESTFNDYGTTEGQIGALPHRQLRYGPPVEVVEPCQNGSGPTSAPTAASQVGTGAAETVGAPSQITRDASTPLSTGEKSVRLSEVSHDRTCREKTTLDGRVEHPASEAQAPCSSTEPHASEMALVLSAGVQNGLKRTTSSRGSVAAQQRSKTSPPSALPVTPSGTLSGDHNQSASTCVSSAAESTSAKALDRERALRNAEPSGSAPPRSDHAESAEPPREPENYASACLAVYRECFRVVRPGGVLVLVVGSYVRGGRIIDLAADTIRLAQAAGWTPWERWRHEKAQVSFWRRLHHRQGRPVVTHEDVLVFVKGDAPAWEFRELQPTHHAPADLTTTAQPAAPTATRLSLWDGD